MSWCFEDEAQGYTDHVLGALIDGEAVVPAIWILDVVNVLLVAERRRRLAEAAAVRFLHLLAGLPIAAEPLPDSSDAWVALLALGRSRSLSAYDASYLDVALRTGLPLATADDRLAAAAEASGIQRFAP